MENQSPLVKFFAFIGFLIVAGFVLKVVLHIAGSLIGLIFSIGIPLAIAYFIVRWLTNRSQSRR